MVDYVTAVRTELVRSKKFLFVPAVGEVHDVVFGEDNQVRHGRLCDSWAVRLGGPKHKDVVLFLYARGNLFATMLLKSNGSWEGRDRKSMSGYVLRPSEEKLSDWVLLGNPIEFQKQMAKSQGFEAIGNLPPQLDWERYGYNLNEIVDRDRIPESNTAVALIACDRPAYFQQVAQSLACNSEMRTLPVFLFIDYRGDGGASKVEQQVELCRQLFPQSVIVRRQRNYGCGRNIIDARIQLFTNMKYDYVFVFEDDMVVSPHYMGITTRLMQWAESLYDNVAAVQGWNQNRESLVRKQRSLDEVYCTYANWWGYLMRKEAWDAIFPDVFEYQELFLGGSYSGRPHRSIIEWFRMKSKGTAFGQYSNRFPIDDESVTTASAYFQTPPTGQDALTMVTLENRGWMRLATTVNRGEYIGRQGIHMNPRRFISDGFDAMRHDIFEEDAELREFRPRGLDEPLQVDRPEDEIAGIRVMEG